MDVPPAPQRLLRASQRAWAAFWASPLAQVVVAADLGALERLFSLADERARLYGAVSRSGERLVPGPKGEPVMSPLYRTITAIDAEVRQLEDRFGLSPRARLNLGIKLGEAARSLGDLAQADDDLDDRDPRLVGVPIPTQSEEGDPS